MSIACIQDANLEDTGFHYTMSLIQGKYKMVILYTLMEFEVVRFNELKKYIRSISYKTLSSTLKELEADGLVHREEYPQIPPKVEYSLTERGKSLIPILDQMCAWGDAHRRLWTPGFPQAALPPVRGKRRSPLTGAPSFVCMDG